MKIFGIMLVKDEVDIVGEVLKDASKWADKIFILDNGSTDGTWELIQSMKNEKIIPWKQYFGAYHNGLRAEIYKEFKKESEVGDWWCFKLDADEFYEENPRDFLAKLPKNIDLVAKKSLDYALSNEDVEEYNFTGNFEQDKNFIKYLEKKCWSEPRFFKEKKNVEWFATPESHYPSNCGKLAKDCILVKHYKVRSPQQLQKRLDIRNNGEAKKKGLAFRHVIEKNWQELLKPRNELVYDDGKRETYDKIPIENTISEQRLLKRIIRRCLFKFGLYDKLQILKRKLHSKKF